MIFMLARVMSNKALVGFRLCSIKNKIVDIYTYEQVKNILTTGTTIENLKLEDGDIKGKGGKLERYSVITVSGELIGKPSVVVTHKDANGYTLVDYNGNVKVFRHNEMEQFAHMNISVANGRLCKNSMGTYYISAIEGEYAKSKQELHTEIQKKYSVPIVHSNDKLETIRPYIKDTEIKYSFCGRPDFKRIFRHKILASAPSRYSDGIKATLGNYTCVFNDLFRTVQEKLIGVTEVVSGNKHYFILHILSIKGTIAFILADDILFIGKEWISIESSTAEEFERESKFIALGQLGLIIVSIASDKVETSCIEYHKITSITKLETELAKYKFKLEALSIKDTNYIIHKANNAIYKLNHNVKISDIPGDTEEGPNEETVTRLHIWNTTDFWYTLNMDVEEYLKEFIVAEVTMVFGDYDKAYFSHSKSLLVKIAKNIAVQKLDYQDDYYTIPWREIKVRYLAYYILYKYGKLDGKPHKSWISADEYKELESHIWGIEIDDEKLEVCLGESRITYSISKMQEMYKTEMSEMQKLTPAIERLNVKLEVLGSSIQINNAGYLIDWDSGTDMVQTEAIKGIKITEENANKPLRLSVRNRLDIIDKQVEYRPAKIELSFTCSALDSFIDLAGKRCEQFHMGISLKGATKKQLNGILSALFRGVWHKKPTVINGTKIKLKEHHTEYGMEFLIANAQSIMRGIELPTADLHCTISDIDEIDISEKNAFVKECVSSIPKRVYSMNNQSLQLVIRIINILYKPKEADGIIKGLISRITDRQNTVTGI